MGSRKTGAPARGETSPAKAHPLWRELNYRQRAYLEAIYRADQNAEAWERSAWSRGWERRPADQWRWLVYHSEFSKIRERLLRQGMVDEGMGSTFAALAGRGLLLTRNRKERTPLGIVEILDVRLTTKGRRMARAGLGERAPEKLPAGGLREWHWRALAKVHAAGERGLDDEDGVSYGRIGWRTWRTWLRDYRGKAHGLGGLVEEREVGYANRSFVHRLFITADGKRFYREHWEEYRKRYPEVEAPFPEEF